MHITGCTKFFINRHIHKIPILDAVPPKPVAAVKEKGQRGIGKLDLVLQKSLKVTLKNKKHKEKNPHPKKKLLHV